ncbi:hypothetical protein [Nocardioides yefusunii]|uniref:hypothetical protein n=2 Tax=Nocardioides yefusunii TaxID=2500546 RepID=UPI0013E3968C|nr:hypothetical protein [Nocardioides yefusunii]
MSNSLSASLGLGGLIAVSLALASQFPGLSPTVSHVLLVLGVTAPVLMTQDLLRYAAIAQARPGAALASDASWAFIVAGGWLMSAVGLISLSPTQGAVLWLTGAIIALMVLVAILRPPRLAPLRQALGDFRGDPRRGHLTLDALLSGATPLVNASAAGAVSTTQVVAASRGASTLFGPLNTLTTSITLAVVPELKRQDKATARRLLRMMPLVLVLGTLVWGAVLSILPDSIGTALLGETWTLAEPLLWVVTIEYVGLGLRAAAAAALRAANRTALVLKIRIGYAAGLCIAPPAAAWIWQSATAFVMAMAVCGVAVGVVAQLLASRAETQNN